MKIVIDNITYGLITPRDEETMEKSIQENSHHIFGENSFYFDVKKVIRSKAGIASIPDGYVILLEPNPKWCIIEVELASHPLYEHLIPQLSKFNRGIADTQTRKKLVEILYEIFNNDEVLKAQLKKQVKTGEIYKFISDLVSEEPLIVVAIDQTTQELHEALSDIRGNVKILEFRTFRREGVSDEINAYVFEPIVDKKIKAGTESLVFRDLEGSGNKKKSIMDSIYSIFDEKGIDNVSYEECMAIARSIKSNTKFNKSHFSWYKRDYRRKKGKGEVTREKDKIDIFDEQHHTGGKPRDIMELFHTIDDYCMNIAHGEVARQYLAKYIRYDYRGNIFCCVHVYVSKLRVWLKLKFNDLDNPPDYVRDVSKIGHWGNGDVEINILNAKALEVSKPIIKKSFEENKSVNTESG
jgi:predicted transport protein